jgi:restriction endonuclease Mrr
MNKTEHAKIYKKIGEALTRSPAARGTLVERIIAGFGLADEEIANRAAGSRHNLLRANIGEALNEMHESGLVGIDRAGRYFLITDAPVVVRIERCESEIIKALTGGEMTRAELRDRLQKSLGANKTATRRDDDLISTYMGHILKRLCERGAVSVSDGVYSLSEGAHARADDINAMLTLKAEFISRLHSRGGEFFENYFMALIKRYYERHGKCVTECYVTGGSADGGIDGVIKTVDGLGFRENIMVQTKNRLEMPSETDVRGFYGAVCAKHGSRGIFVTTSDFHSAAREFLDSIDNCVGVNGDAVFKIALDVMYGIKKTASGFAVDERII